MKYLKFYIIYLYTILIVYNHLGWNRSNPVHPIIGRMISIWNFNYKRKRPKHGLHYLQAKENHSRTINHLLLFSYWERLLLRCSYLIIFTLKIFLVL